MAKDNIANYVIKTAIEYAPLDMKKQIFDELSRNMIELVCILHNIYLNIYTR